MASVRVLIAEDHELFRRFVCSTLGKRPEFEVICEVSDGFEAVQKAEKLQPDLIVLDIGLPSLNGLEAARRIRRLCPDSKILFLSQESHVDVVQEALRLGASGYVVKKRAGTELITAVEAVCRGGQFVSNGLSGHDCAAATDAQIGASALFEETSPSLALEESELTRCHEVHFYSDDASFLESLIPFIATSLKAGNMTIVVVTEPHGKALLQHLQTHAPDCSVAIEEGLYLSLDVSESLSQFMDGTGPNRKRFFSTFGPLLRSAVTIAEAKHTSVVVFDEMAMALCAEGRMKAAMELEQLTNELLQRHRFILRCAYQMTDDLQGEPYAKICAEHSAVASSKVMIS